MSEKGDGLPHILHALQDLVAGRLGVVLVVVGRLGATGELDAIVVVVVVVVLVVGPVNVDVTGLAGMKCHMSSFLDILFF